MGNIKLFKCVSENSKEMDIKDRRGNTPLYYGNKKKENSKIKNKKS